MWWWKRQERRAEPQPDATAARDELLSAYLDAGLTTDDQSLLLIELDADEELRDALEGMREVKAALASLGELRAPRSFALAAAPVAAPRGLSRLELGTRFGAIAAAVAFVLVLGADLRGGGAEPVVINTTAANSSLAGGAASDAASGSREGFAPEAPAAAGASSGSGASSSAEDSAAPGYTTPPVAVAPAAPSVTQSAERLDGQGGTPTTMLAPATGATAPTPEATAAAGSVAPVPSPGADEKAQGGGSGGAAGSGANPSSVEPATPAAGTDASSAATPTTDEAQPAPAPDAPVSSAGAVPGSSGNASRAGAPTLPTVIPDVSAPGLGLGVRVSVEQSAGLDVWRLSEIGIGMLMLVLAAGAAGMWYMRHREGAGS
jgi:hypothetical protein